MCNHQSLILLATTTDTDTDTDTEHFIITREKLVAYQYISVHR